MKQSIIWRGLSFLSLLFLNIFLSRFLKAEGIGFVFYLTNLFSLWVLIGSFNLDGSFTYFSASKNVHYNQLALLCIIWAIATSVICFFLFPVYFNFFDNDLLANGFKLSVYGFYYLLGIILANYFIALFYSLGDFRLPNIILATSNLLFIALIHFGNQTYASSRNIINDYFYFIFLQGIALLVAFFIKHKSYLNYKLPNIVQLKQIASYSAIGLTGNFIFFFVYRLDYWFVKNWCHQNGDLGNYIQASKLAQMLLILPQILASSIFPAVASGEKNELIVKNISKLFKLFLILYIIIIISFLVLGKWMLPAVFGDSFNAMYYPLLILLPGIFCLSISALLSAYFSGNKQNKYNVYAALLALFIMITLSYFFKNNYTIKTAAVISSVAYFFEAGYCFIIFLRQAKINPKDFFSFKAIDFKTLNIFNTSK
ncbi:MAG: lipopolysaccharide biosynthesis protein [Chitinophagaceae bacterium]